MGGTPSRSVYAAAPELVSQIVEHEELTALQTHDAKLDVSLANTTSLNPYRHLYTVMLNRQVPRTCPLVCVFPQHPLPKHRILCTADYSAMHTLGIVINERIAKSMCGYFFVLCGDYVYRIADFTGNIYLVWCTHVNQSNRNEQLTNLAPMMPAICEMDGYSRAKNFVLLDSVNGKAKMLQISSLTVHTPYRKVLIWSCERTAEEPPETRLPTFSEAESLARVTASVMDSTVVVPALQPVVATESDDEQELQFIQETPRIQNPL